MKGKYIIHGPGVDITLYTNGPSHLVVPNVTKLIRANFMTPDDAFDGWNSFPDPNVVSDIGFGSINPYANMNVIVKQITGDLVASRLRTTMSVMFRKRIPAKAIEAGQTEGEFWL